MCGNVIIRRRVDCDWVWQKYKTAKMIPRQYEPLTARAHFMEIPFGKFAVSIVSLPFFSFIFCVLWSVLYFYDRSTATHCNVPNYLPSISAAIGNYQPQRFIWQCAILLQALPRFLVAQQYLRHNSNRIRRSRRAFAYLAFILNIIENISLVGLSLWNSSDFYGSQLNYHLTRKLRFYFEELVNLVLSLQKFIKFVSSYLLQHRNVICLFRTFSIDIHGR